MDVLEQEKYRQAVWYHVPAITCMLYNRNHSIFNSGTSHNQSNTQHKQNSIFILLSVSGTFLCQILKGLFITYPKKLGSKLKFGHFFKLDHYNLIVHNWKMFLVFRGSSGFGVPWIMFFLV